MREWKLTGEEIGRAFKRWSKLLTCDLKNKGEGFERELGIPQEKLGKLIVKHPQFASYDLKRVKEDFERKLGIPKEELGKLIVRDPRLPGYNIENNIKPKLELLRGIGVGKEEEMEEFLKIAACNVRACQLIVDTAQKSGVKIESGREIRTIYKRLEWNISKTKGLSVAKFIKRAKLKKREQAMKEEIKRKLGNIFDYYLKKKKKKPETL